MEISIGKCHICESRDLTWFTTNVVTTGVQQNRLNTNDVRCKFVLGCNDCGETLKVVDCDHVAELLNATNSSLKEPSK